ncbi:hypothetical protein BU064_13085 [Staphylococcus succinus]|nr:hypothetical protein BU064_13085 [Staphylococcus succinus]
MHSPIIYIVQNENGLFQQMNYQLEEDLVPCEEYLDECLVESDWHVPNTIERKNWHRGEWSIGEMFDKSPYFDVEKFSQTIKLQINYKNIRAWEEDLIKVQDKYVEKQREKLMNNEIFYPRYDLDFYNYMKLRDKIGDAYGGTAYVLYKEYQGELELYDVFKEKDLIDYCKLEMINQNKKAIDFEVCLNVVGDYHY